VRIAVNLTASGFTNYLARQPGQFDDHEVSLVN
jgi:hypothetical protein